MTTIAKYGRSQQLLSHILEQPQLVTAIQSLQPEVLTKLVRHVGLEDAGELVGLMTTDQIMEVFDEDLWKSERPGDDEVFDDERFGLWLEVLIESGVGLAARKVAEMDEDLVTLALSRQILVIDADELANQMSDSHRAREYDLLDKQLDSCLYQEFEQYQAISRNHRTWEAIRALLVELDSQHHEFLVRLLERCCNIAHDYIDDNGGLYEVLSSEELVESDVSGAREERREKKGFVPPSSASAFLRHACVEQLTDLLASDKIDPTTNAHFRVAGAGQEVAAPGRGSHPMENTAASKLLQTLAIAEVIPPSRAIAQLGPGSKDDAQPKAAFINAAMTALRQRSDAVYTERLNELAYLANVLIVGCEYRFREFRPLEAAQAALGITNLGADYVSGVQSPRSAKRDAIAFAERLERLSLVKLFRVGWHILHHRVVLRSAQLLSERIGAGGDARASARLAVELKAGRPWRANPQLQDLWMVSESDEGILFSLMQQLPLAFASTPRADEQDGWIETCVQLRDVEALLERLAPRSRTTKKRAATVAKTKTKKQAPAAKIASRPKPSKRPRA